MLKLVVDIAKGDLQTSFLFDKRTIILKTQNRDIWDSGNVEWAGISSLSLHLHDSKGGRGNGETTAEKRAVETPQRGDRTRRLC